MSTSPQGICMIVSYPLDLQIRPVAVILTDLHRLIYDQWLTQYPFLDNHRVNVLLTQSAREK